MTECKLTKGMTHIISEQCHNHRDIIDRAITGRGLYTSAYIMHSVAPMDQRLPWCMLSNNMVANDKLKEIAPDLLHCQMHNNWPRKEYNHSF